MKLEASYQTAGAGGGGRGGGKGGEGGGRSERRAVGRLACSWRLLEAAGWQAGRLAGWRAGGLAGSRAGRLAGWEREALESSREDWGLDGDWGGLGLRLRLRITVFLGTRKQRAARGEGQVIIRVTTSSAMGD